MQTIDELEKFMFKHGENIVDMLGGEIDRIELKLRVSLLLKHQKEFSLRFSYLHFYPLLYKSNNRVAIFVLYPN